MEPLEPLTRQAFTDDWLVLAKAVGLDEPPEPVLGVRFAVDAYVRFCKDNSWVIGAAAALTELFAPDHMADRIIAWRKHYPWIDEAGYAYFEHRIPVVRADSLYTLGLVAEHSQTRQDQEAAIAALRFKCDVLWAMTDAIGLTAERLADLRVRGLDHVQLSIQDAQADRADAIAGIKAHERKLAVAKLVTDAGLPFSVNVVLYRHNIERLAAIAQLALDLGAQRLELAHTQYYGWGLLNRAALLPSREEVALADHTACPAASVITTLEPVNVLDQSLDLIWYSSDVFNEFRRTDWLQEPCRGCPRREIDFGGCRCQAFQLTGDAAATDPACSLSPRHDLITAAVEAL